MHSAILTWMVVAVLLLAGLAPAHAQDIPNPFPPQSVTTMTLPNGLRVVVREDHSLPIVAAVAVVRGGSSCEANTRGIAHYLEHLVFKGSRQYPEPLAAQLALEQAGGVSNATTSRDATRFEAVLPADQAPLAVSVLADVTLAPTLSDEAFRGERQLILEELQREMDDPLTEVTRQAQLFSYRTHPYRNNPSGDVREVLALTPEDVRAFHARWYVPNNMSLVLVGDITTQRALQLATASFGSARPVPLPELPRPEAPQTGAPTTIHFTRDLQGTYLAMSFAAPSSGNFTALVAMDALVTLLADGPDAALTGWWAKDGLRVSNFGGEFISTRDPGRLVIWAQADPASIAPLRESTLGMLTAAARGVLPDQMLAAAKARLAAQFLLENETYSAQASTLAFYEGLGGAQWACQYLPAIKGITMDNLRAVAPIECLTAMTIGQDPAQ